MGGLAGPNELRCWPPPTPPDTPPYIHENSVQRTAAAPAASGVRTRLAGGGSRDAARLRLSRVRGPPACVKKKYRKRYKDRKVPYGLVRGSLSTLTNPLKASLMHGHSAPVFFGINAPLSPRRSELLLAKTEMHLDITRIVFLLPKQCVEFVLVEVRRRRPLVAVRNKYQRSKYDNPISGPRSSKNHPPHPDPLAAPTRPVDPTLAPTRPSRPAPFFHYTILVEGGAALLCGPTCTTDRRFLRLGVSICRDRQHRARLGVGTSRQPRRM